MGDGRLCSGWVGGRALEFLGGWGGFRVAGVWVCRIDETLRRLMILELWIQLTLGSRGWWLACRSCNAVSHLFPRQLMTGERSISLTTYTETWKSAANVLHISVLNTKAQHSQLTPNDLVESILLTALKSCHFRSRGSWTIWTRYERAKPLFARICSLHFEQLVWSTLIVQVALGQRISAKPSITAYMYAALRHSYYIMKHSFL